LNLFERPNERDAVEGRDRRAQRNVRIKMR
jgi:hypothetical protein